MIAKKTTYEKLEPVFNFIIAREVKPKEQSKVLLPDSAKKETPALLEAVRVGPGIPDGNGNIVKPCVQEGDVFRFGNGVQKFVHDGETLFLLPDNAVRMIVRE